MVYFFTVSKYLPSQSNTSFIIWVLGMKMKTGTEGSRLGLHLASALKAYGLVNHSIWNELDSR